MVINTDNAGPVHESPLDQYKTTKTVLNKGIVFHIESYVTKQLLYSCYIIGFSDDSRIPNFTYGLKREYTLNSYYADTHYV